MPYSPRQSSTYGVIVEFLKENRTISRNDIKRLITGIRNKTDNKTLDGVLSYIKRKKLIKRQNNEYVSCFYKNKPSEELYIIVSKDTDAILSRRNNIIDILKDVYTIPETTRLFVYEVKGNKKILMALR